MDNAIYKLDNPVWYALTERHSYLCETFSNLRFYKSEFCTFGAVFDCKNAYSGFEDYGNTIDEFYIVGAKPNLPEGFEIKSEVVCDQMVSIRGSRVKRPLENEIITLQSCHIDQFISLVNLVQPGYIRPKTHEMGSFYGIFEEDQLVATAGIRIQLNEFAEVSSIVTHPDHQRKGYATAITEHCIRSIESSGRTAYLHVLETNTGAISM